MADPDALREVLDARYWVVYEPSTTEERLGLAYWFAMHSSFESAGVLTFARALIAAFEAREHDVVRRMLVTVTRDAPTSDFG